MVIFHRRFLLVCRRAYWLEWAVWPGAQIGKGKGLKIPRLRPYVFESRSGHTAHLVILARDLTLANMTLNLFSDILLY